MTDVRPNTEMILGQLKDFQRATVDYVFKRLYLDEDFVRRFLVADEVGLGKTLVARGLIAKAIDHLWDKTPRIDILYVCSNADIARQNINRLNVTGQHDFTLSSRITLLPIDLGGMQRRRLNFVSFTPSTSFELTSNSGWSRERELLYWLLARSRHLSFKAATRVLEGTAGTDAFRDRVRAFPSYFEINEEIAAQFLQSLEKHADLWTRFEGLCEAMPRAGAEVPRELHWERNQVIGELRVLLAQTCLQWLQPDLIILDEFQRFKHLLEGGSEDANEAAQLAHHLFNYQENQADSALAARVLLLSATPYRMYTMSHEAGEDDHYGDLRKTLEFLLPEVVQREACFGHLRRFREELLHVLARGPDGMLAVKSDLESSLHQIMVRTERLALTSDRNGMLVEKTSDSTTLAVSDVRHYLGLQRVARNLELDDVMEYWKSAPYLLNFMEEYEIKRKMRDALDREDQDPAFVRAMRQASSSLLGREDIERYARLDPANARLRGLHADLVSGGAWKLLWISPSLPYYKGQGAYADPSLMDFTKRLVFSCWRVVPKAIAAFLSYEAERSMMHSFRRKVRNTPEARKKRRPLLRFTFSKGRPNGMAVLGLLYPCKALAERLDPLAFVEQAGSSELPSLDVVVRQSEEKVKELLGPIIAKVQIESGPIDESWYWAAPLLLDAEYDGAALHEWFSRDDLAELWSGGPSREDDGGTAWSRHIELARELLAGRLSLGPPPEDLASCLALCGLAGPGVAALRALGRIVPASENDTKMELRSFAAPLAHAFLHLFNLPEVMALVRDPKKEKRYWRSVLEYCAAGNLQAVLDEYAHLLVESLGLVGKDESTIAEEISKAVQRSLTLRTSTAQAEMIQADKRRIKVGEPLRFRTRFAMRFGDQDVEDSSEPTRADHVRAAFNSPFWPFVLATTSVGQEGLDFHHYCHAVVHWNLPSNPVDLEQREGRVHRYKGHALRKNISSRHGRALPVGCNDPWTTLFATARAARAQGQNDLFPYWVVPDGAAKIERHILALPHSREIDRQVNLRRSLVVYRMVFGQNRQEDLIHFLIGTCPKEEVERLANLCRIDLSPPEVKPIGETV